MCGSNRSNSNVGCVHQQRYRTASSSGASAFPSASCIQDIDDHGQATASEPGGGDTSDQHISIALVGECEHIAAVKGVPWGSTAAAARLAGCLGTAGATAAACHTRMTGRL
jgi:hypothetical protein